MTPIAASATPSSEVSSFTNPDLYRQAVRGLHAAEYVVVGKGLFRNELTRVDFERLRTQQGHETLAKVAWMKNAPTHAAISFATRMNQAPMTDNGIEVYPGEMLFQSLGNTHHARTAADYHWGGLSLTPEDLAAVGRAITGRELAVPAITRRLRPAPALMVRLIDLQISAGLLAKAAPEILAHSEVSRALEQNLLHVLVRCLTDGTLVEPSKANLRHTAAMARLEDLLMANVDRPLHLAELCTALAVSERTLRLCCEEYIGMGPIQYLWLRRMTLAHRALIRAEPGTTTVTDIATGHGFWELGRFAVAYRALFGESPSETLAHPPVDRRTSTVDPLALDAW